jgi:hypothetical protein
MDFSAEYTEWVRNHSHFHIWSVRMLAMSTGRASSRGWGAGLGPDVLSAYSDFAFEILHPLPEENGGSDQM